VGSTGRLTRNDWLYTPLCKELPHRGIQVGVPLNVVAEVRGQADNRVPWSSRWRTQTGGQRETRHRLPGVMS
jgi:hypothetical protein